MQPLILDVKFTLREEMLGMTAGDPELATAHLAKKHKNGIPPQLETALHEERDCLPSEEEQIEKASTLFPRDENGNPMLWDYQIRGALKDWIRGLVEIKHKFVSGPGKGWNPWNVGKGIDTAVFVFPRKLSLFIPDGKTTGICERPLRAQTLRGERIALARSETVPSGTEFSCEIHILNPKYEDDIRAAIDYGSKYRGLGQWRNSGKGAFDVEITQRG